MNYMLTLSFFRSWQIILYWSIYDNIKDYILNLTAYYICNLETVRLTAGTFLWFSVLDFQPIMVLISAGTIALWRIFNTSWASTSWLVWLGVFGWPWTSTFSVSSLALRIETSRLELLFLSHKEPIHSVCEKLLVSVNFCFSLCTRCHESSFSLV